MLAPRYVREELKLIDSLYFAVFNPNIREGKSMSFGRGRWQIRKWEDIHPKRLSLWNEFSKVILTICKEEMTEDGLIDAGYEEIDYRAILAIRESHWFLLKAKEEIAALDWRNERKERQVNAELEYQSKYAAHRIWRNYKEPTVNLSGKEWKI